MFLRATSQFISFEGDAAAKAAAAEAAKVAATEAAVAAEAAAAEATKAAGEKKFTQEQLNTFIAEEKRKNQLRERKILGELETLKTSASLTTEEKETLEKRIEDLQTQNMTGEEKARRAEEAAEKKNVEAVTNLTKERDNWQTKHANLVINTAIITTASEGENKAISHEQILAILQPKTKLVEQLDDDGKPTGNYEPKVSFPDNNKENEPIILELTVPEAIKRMKELEKYGNLFEGIKTGGLGGTGSTTKGGKIDIDKLAKDPAAYRKYRKETPEIFAR